MDQVKFHVIGKPGLHVWQRPVTAMSTSHIHTDVEWNLVLKGAMHYFFAGRFQTLPERRLAVFWGGMPHRLLSITPPAECLTLTLPVAWFTQWQLSGDFPRRLLAGEFFMDSESRADDDCRLMQQWIQDLSVGDPERRQVVALEVEARLRRFGWAMSRQEAPPKADVSAV